MTDTTLTEAIAEVKPEALIDLIGELGRQVYYLLDDCETSGDIGSEVHTITDEGLAKVSAILDQIDALPFQEPGYILGPGAKLEAAIKQTFIPASDARLWPTDTGNREANFDNDAVYQFARMMREKMDKSRAKGRTGWNDPALCSPDYLRTLLYEHIYKGDPVDVANICMMLRHYQEPTTPQPKDDLRLASDARLAVSEAEARGWNNAMLTAISHVAESRNVHTPGPIFKALNETMGKIDDARFAGLRRYKNDATEAAASDAERANSPAPSASHPGEASVSDVPAQSTGKDTL